MVCLLGIFTYSIFLVHGGCLFVFFIVRLVQSFEQCGWFGGGSVARRDLALAQRWEPAYGLLVGREDGRGL